MKRFRVVVTNTKPTAEFDYEIVYVSANLRIKAERMAIIAASDYWGTKTSQLEAKAEETDRELSPEDFIIYVAVAKEDTDV